MKTMPEPRAKTAEKALRKSSSHGVKSMPIETGIVLWKTMAPVILPMSEGVLIVPHPDDGVELLRQFRSQRRQDERNQASRYADGHDRCSTASTKKWAPKPITTTVPMSWVATAHVGA